MFGFGAGSGDADFTGWALMTLSLGLVPFTLQYICLRAFYALENTRTPFFLQLLITSCYVTLGVLVSTFDRLQSAGRGVPGQRSGDGVR